MNKQMILLTAVVLLTGFAVAEDIEQPHISVYGTAEIKVVPNEMVWSLTVTTKDKELKKVANEQIDAVKQVLDFLKGLEIEQSKLQTSRMRFGENWKTVDRERVRDGYFATTQIGFTITDFDLYQTLWFGLAEIESVSIDNTSFTHSERIRYQNESRQKAVLAAREKANTLANTLGSKIAEPLLIEEMAAQTFSGSNFLSNSVNFDATVAGGLTTDDILALGTISINTRVRVVFKLESSQ